MYLNKLFSDEKINTGRQVELDIAKALSIIFMVFVHILMVAPAFNNTISPSYLLIVGNILGRPCAAPVFMFCLGVGIIYSRRSQWIVILLRGHFSICRNGIYLNRHPKETELFQQTVYYSCSSAVSDWFSFKKYGFRWFCFEFILRSFLRNFWWIYSIPIIHMVYFPCCRIHLGTILYQS